MFNPTIAPITVKDHGSGFQADVNLAEGNVGPFNTKFGLSASTGVYEEDGVTHTKVLGTGIESSDGYVGISLFGNTIGFGDKRHAEKLRRLEKELRRQEEERKQREKEFKRQEEEHKKREQQLSEEVKKYKSADFEKWTILKNDDSMSSLLRKIGSKYPGTEMEKLRAYARDEFGIDPKNFNLAITGQAGVGKSTLINAICGYDVKDLRAAKIGVAECTQEVKGYPHPDVKHLVLYDLPGAGTDSHPIDTYFCDKRLYAVDFMLVVMAKRTFANDLTLAKIAQDRRIPVVFVRNQTENDFETIKEENDDKEEEELIQLTKSEVRNNICKELEKVGIKDPKIFLIEARSLRKATTTKSEDLSQFGELKFEELDLLDYLSKLHHPRSGLSLKGLKRHQRRA